MSFSINSDLAPECANVSINNDEIKQVIHWDTLHPSDIGVYRECTKAELSKVNVPPGACANVSINNDEIKQVIHWDTLHPSDIGVYRECTKAELSKVNVPPGVKCSDPN